MLTETQQQTIRTLIQNAHADDDFRRQLTMHFDALHVYADMGGSLLIRPTGEVLGVNHDEDKYSIEAVGTRWADIACVAACERFPELAFLRPLRQARDEDWRACAATGRLMRAYCGACHGLGFLRDR